jgi:phospholipid/cholesterol/gamma-HCH transport system substrate-binding protein
MSTSRTQKIRLGLFGVAAALALAVVLAVFAGLRFWERHDSYVIYFDDSVMGLERGAEVMFAGVRIGRVERIDLVPDELRKVKVTIAVKRGLPIRTDTTATLQFAGITGLKLIDLRGGSPEAAYLPPGSVLPAEQALLDRIEQTAQRLTNQTEELMDGAGRVMDNLELTSDELRTMVSENRVALRGTIAAVGEAARHATAMMKNDLPRVITGAGALVEDLRGVVRSNQTHLRTAMFDLRQASRNFKDLSRDLRQRPSRILFSRAARDRAMP